jgi:hypothetical protein
MEPTLPISDFFLLKAFRPKDGCSPYREDALTVQNIQIIGAGIAGPDDRPQLRPRGHEVAIVEQAPALSEVGAGLQMSPNASRVLMGLGLGDALDSEP